ncbi:hypothetical protein BLNAU_5380 [Blattamonas nauphoetae]|uniref:Uncharacterized protein n=1 Tax=Blattamonas nauphoetae TaxID=2049346 RepID=A0ABQ9Y799_9EUKA|nr:hypothetical protein BLNAU_5380 [Blattamonas nauphoetae]
MSFVEAYAVEQNNVIAAVTTVKWGEDAKVRMLSGKGNGDPDDEGTRLDMIRKLVKTQTARFYEGNKRTVNP